VIRNYKSKRMVVDKENIQENDWSNWTSIISNYLQPSRSRSWWQLINSIVPYFGLLVAMYYSMEISYWLTLAISPLAAGFMVRIFIIFHDCGHGSFFISPRANQITGIILFIRWRVYKRVIYIAASTASSNSREPG